MNISRSEACLKERSDIKLPEVIRNKAETEGLYDYEIARILNVDLTSR
jgi:hypothetical protein